MKMPKNKQKNKIPDINYTFLPSKKVRVGSVVSCSNGSQSRVYRGDMPQPVAHSLAAYGSYLCLVQVQSEVRTPGRAPPNTSLTPASPALGRSELIWAEERDVRVCGVGFKRDERKIHIDKCRGRN